MSAAFAASLSRMGGVLHPCAAPVRCFVDSNGRGTTPVRRTLVQPLSRTLERLGRHGMLALTSAMTRTPAMLADFVDLPNPARRTKNVKMLGKNNNSNILSMTFIASELGWPGEGCWLAAGR